LGESCRNNGKKGKGVRVIGRLKQERWQDANGMNRSRIAVAAEQIEFRLNFNSSASGQDKPEDGTSPDEGAEAAEKGFIPTF
jgi:single-strand DNA-binding protein